jgi:hypothetical protein
MNPPDSRGREVKPGLTGTDCSKDRGSIVSLARPRQPVAVEGRGDLLVYRVSKF